MGTRRGVSWAISALIRCFSLTRQLVFLSWLLAARQVQEPHSMGALCMQISSLTQHGMALPPRRTSPAPGERWRAVILEPRHHDAGWPKYAQANAPQRRGAVELPVGMTLDSENSMSSQPGNGVVVVGICASRVDGRLNTPEAQSK